MMGSGESSCPLPRSAPVVRPLNSPFSSEMRVGACCLASMDSTARRLECHRHPPSPHSACIDANPTMKMEAILAKTVSGRIASVLILYQVDFWFLRPRITQKPEVYLVLLHLEALSSPIIAYVPKMPIASSSACRKDQRVAYEDPDASGEPRLRHLLSPALLVAHALFALLCCVLGCVLDRTPAAHRS